MAKQFSLLKVRFPYRGTHFFLVSVIFMVFCLLFNIEIELLKINHVDPNYVTYPKNMMIDIVDQSKQSS